MSLLIRSRGAANVQARYRASIEQVLRDIRRTNTGRIVIGHIERDRHRVVISPYLEGGAPNASATPGSELSGGTFSADRTALGTGSFIAFSVARSVLPANVPQGRADEVLLHEMAHALRQINGVERLVRRGGRIELLQMASFESVEEFFAAMVASVHSSELGRRILGNHGSWPLRNPDVLNRPPYSTRLRQIVARMPNFAGDMARISETVAPFNPFRNVVNGVPI
ncbi:type III secretion system effector protein [Pareuzebyella sediminis]|uniref:hypothetical protein n=1 Tax=Pareuzebyella sediminis TaxID=2607998 RepID=UPI0011F05A99|nr:hypothetical protein [Pareuzebyella sediminis]